LAAQTPSPEQLETDLAALYDGLPCGHLSLLPNGKILKINQTLLSWLGYDDATEVILKKRFQDFLGPGDRIFYDTHFGPLLQMQRSANEINFSIRKKDGTAFPALVSASQNQDEAGKPVLIRIALFQIHDRKKYESELLLERRKAEQALRAKADFVSLLTHEIRTPLNSIIGVSHLLTSTELTEEQKKLSDMLLASFE
jgi:PAS domain S-box-containing protein